VTSRFGRAVLPIAAAIVGFLAGGTAQAETQADVEALVSWSVGEWSNAAQMAGPKADRQAASPRHLFVTRLADGVFGGTALYYEWREPDARGPIIRTRVWAFSPKPGGIEMRFYTLNESAAKPLAGVHSPEAAEAATVGLSLSDLHGHPDNCHFLLERKGEAWEGWAGDGTCRIYNRIVERMMVPRTFLRFGDGFLLEDSEYSYEKTEGVPPEQLKGPDSSSSRSEYRRVTQPR